MNDKHQDAPHALTAKKPAKAHLTDAKFRRRFGFVERRLAQAGRSLGEAPLADMEELWQQAKATEPPQKS